MSDVSELGPLGPVSEAEDPLFGSIQGQRDVRGLFIRVCGCLECCIQQTSEKRLFLDDVRIAFDVHRGVHARTEFGEIADSTNLLELVPARQLELGGQPINLFLAFK